MWKFEFVRVFILNFLGFQSCFFLGFQSCSPAIAGWRWGRTERTVFEPYTDGRCARLSGENILSKLSKFEIFDFGFLIFWIPNFPMAQLILSVVQAWRMKARVGAWALIKDDNLFRETFLTVRNAVGTQRPLERLSGAAFVSRLLIKKIVPFRAYGT